MKKYFQGYAGMVAVRSKGLIFKGDRLYLYLLDGQGELLLHIPHADFDFYSANPELFSVSKKSRGNSTEVSTIPRVGRESLLRLAVFRKAELADLPAYE